ncbi:MAG: NAD(P)-dependent oxidoreductase, partial [Rhodobacterales bacterium CG_4_10_14_0_8_um_filter_70_9]
MSDKPVVGFVGVGLMGWGMAKNVVEKGWPLRVIAHRKREAVDDLVKRGAVEVATLAEMAAACDTVVLCVTGAPEVQAVVAALTGEGSAVRTIIDTSTSEPDVTARLAAALGAQGVAFIDAPLSRTPTHTWAGEATTYVSGGAASVEKYGDLLSAWASVVIPIDGPPGVAH